ncbi:MAG: coenzyme F420 hydrogenase/dehydrogenase beta subunit N-terminal domain-containing protein, partial [Solirubrobacterales bacterium]
MVLAPAREQEAASAALDAAIERVVNSGNCSGCGACALLDPGLELRLDAEGFLRPVRRTSSGDPGPAPAPASVPASPLTAVERFAAACPGVTVTAANPAGAVRHPTMGPVVRAWNAWATDSEIRHRGSSGGALTAIAAWLLETGQAARMVGARADPAEPRRTVSVTIVSKEQAIGAAGSRYAPTASASQAAA